MQGSQFDHYFVDCNRLLNGVICSIHVYVYLTMKYLKKNGFGFKLLMCLL